ncbi:MAG: sortase [Patescibacteria group bacterium]
MLQTQKNTQQVVSFLLGIALLSIALGATATFVGRNVIGGTLALEKSEVPGNFERRIRREKRLQKLDRVLREIGKTYPMQTSMLLRGNLSRKWEVALDQGNLKYARLGITTPVSKPSLTRWKQRNWFGLEDQMQFGLLHGVVAYPHSPEPGEAGIVIIAGHSSAPTIEAQSSPYREVFARLPEARVGDVIELRSEDGAVYSYEVYDTAIIPPTETSILLQDKNVQELTLFTCYPIGTTQERFVVHARLRAQPAIAGEGEAM